MRGGARLQGIGTACMIGLVFMLVHVRFIHANQTQASPGTHAPVLPLPAWLTLAGNVEIEATRQQNFDLTPPENDTRSLLRPELQFEIRTTPWAFIEGLLLLEFSHEIAVQDDTDEDEPDRIAFSVKEAWVQFEEPFGIPLSLQIGRQSFEDERQWLYDEELDAIRIRYRRSRFYLEAAIARVAVVDKDFINGTGMEDTDYYQLYGQYDFGPRLTLAAYGLAQDDHQPLGERPVFFGIQARGELIPQALYWLDAAHVRGKDGDRRIRAWGVDVGLTYIFDLPWQPSLTGSFAFGSGDDTPESSTDTRFRQTGLQGNGAEIASLTEIQYYGEALDPELSNLLVFTAALGLQPIQDVSLTVMYHVYRQHTRSTEFRDVAIDAEPTGQRRDVGREIDVLGVWAIDNVEFKFVFGVFFPGKAFPKKTSNAFFAQFRLQVEF